MTHRTPGPTYRIVNDDDPADFTYPCECSLADLVDTGDDETLRAVSPLARGESVTVGGGAAVQFTITRID